VTGCSRSTHLRTVDTQLEPSFTSHAACPRHWPSCGQNSTNTSCCPQLQGEGQTCHWTVDDFCCWTLFQVNLFKLLAEWLQSVPVCRRRTWSTWRWWSVWTCTWMRCLVSSWKVRYDTRVQRTTWRRRLQRHRQWHHQRSDHLTLSWRLSTVDLSVWLQAVSTMMQTAGHRKTMTLFRWIRQH